MPKYDRAVRDTGVAAQRTSPVKTTGPAPTYEGGAGFTRDTLGELFTLAITNLGSEDTFYESGKDRDSRFVKLIHEATKTDPEWVARFVPYLRNVLNLRTAPMVMAVEYARAAVSARLMVRCDQEGCDTETRWGDTDNQRWCDEHRHSLTTRLPHPIPDPTTVLDSALQRADEPAEALAYYETTNKWPTPPIAVRVKRGVAAAAQRLYNQRSALKYDSNLSAWRMGDVLTMTRPEPKDEQQSALFHYLIDVRHSRPDEDCPNPELLEHLSMIKANRELMALPVAERRGVLLAEDLPALKGVSRLQHAGITWEVLAGWLQGPMDKDAWESVIPSMGYMALLRNMRNFDQAGVSDETVDKIIAKLTNPEEVAASRQLPFRFFSAYRNQVSDRWGRALEKALNLSLANVPELPGKTLVLVDTSGSMQTTISGKSSVKRTEVGALLAIAFAHKNDVDLRGFADGTFEHPIARGESVLRIMDRFDKRNGEVGHGTRTVDAVRNTFDPRVHKRVLIVSDMQTFASYDPFGSHRGSVSDRVPSNVPLYSFNTAGYETTHAPSGHGNRHEFGGLSDATLTMLSALESRQNAEWPF